MAQVISQHKPTEEVNLRRDLNNVVKKASWRAQRTLPLIWNEVYREIEKRTGKDINALATKFHVTRIDVLESENLLKLAINITKEKYRVRYE